MIKLNLCTVESFSNAINICQLTVVIYKLEGEASLMNK